MKTLLCTLSVVSTLIASVGAQSLADVAKAEAARRAAVTKQQPVKVITQDDLKPADSPSSSAAAAPATSDTVSAVATTTTDKEKTTVKDEAYWRGRMRTLTTKFLADLPAAEVAHQRYEDAYALYQSQFVPDPQNGAIIRSARAAALETEMRRLDGEWKVAIAATDADQAAIEALKEEGRKAGALPGWFR